MNSYSFSVLVGWVGGARRVCANATTWSPSILFVFVFVCGRVGMIFVIDDFVVCKYL